MSQEKKELQVKYEKLYGKKAYHGFDVDKLQELITAKENGEDEDVEADDNTFKGITIDPDKTYTFKLNKSANPRTLLPREAPVWDEDTKSTRLIRLCKTEVSPYADEQEEGARPDSTVICFTDGELKVSGSERNKIKFLLAYDGYDKKTKVLSQNTYIKGKYRLVDQGAIILSALDLERAKNKAKALVDSAKLEDLSNFLRSAFLEDVVNKDENHIRLIGLQKADEDPSLFLKEFTDPIHKVRANVQKLFVKGELTDADGVVRWKDTQGVILNFEGRADEALAKFVLIGSKEAKDFQARMEEKLK